MRIGNSEVEEVVVDESQKTDFQIEKDYVEKQKATIESEKNIRWEERKEELLCKYKGLLAQGWLFRLTDEMKEYDIHDELFHYAMYIRGALKVIGFFQDSPSQSQQSKKQFGYLE